MEYVREATLLSELDVNVPTSALYRDACLYVVPGSHDTPRTPRQRALSETQDAPKDPLDMPGAIQVILERAQFF